MSTYKYVCCNSCRWREDTDEASDPNERLAHHVTRCPAANPWLLVPMWSVAWPWYWAVERGEIPADHFGLEMEWRHVGSHTAKPRLYTTGGDSKEWFLFSNVVLQQVLRQVREREAEQPADNPRFHVAPSEDAQREQQGNDEADDRGDKKQE